MTPDEIITQIHGAHFLGYPDMLSQAIWNLLEDVLDSVKLADEGGDTYETVRDYVVNHYDGI